MYAQGTSRFEVPAGQQTRSVTVRRLDTLFAEGLIPQVDFLKVDVEGFEKDVLLGADNLLANALGVETETNFGVSDAYPKSHFGTLAEILLEHHLLVFDLAFNRIPRASFRRALESRGVKTDSQHGGFGKPAMVNVLFCRDLIDETDAPSKYHTPCKPFTLDQLIKMMIIYELHGLNDIAVDTAERFAEPLGSRFDVARAIRLLANQDCRPGRAGNGARRTAQAHLRYRAFDELAGHGAAARCEGNAQAPALSPLRSRAHAKRLWLAASISAILRVSGRYPHPQTDLLRSCDPGRPFAVMNRR